MTRVQVAWYALARRYGTGALDHQPAGGRGLEHHVRGILRGALRMATDDGLFGMVVYLVWWFARYDSRFGAVLAAVDNSCLEMALGLSECCLVSAYIA